MDPQALLKEMDKFATVRPVTWQGASARSGPVYKHTAQTEQADVAMDTSSDASASTTSAPLWTRLSNATGSASHGAAIVRLMQKHLLEYVDDIPLDQIELMAKREVQ